MMEMGAWRSSWNARGVVARRTGISLHARAVGRSGGRDLEKGAKRADGLRRLAGSRHCSQEMLSLTAAQQLE